MNDREANILIETACKLLKVCRNRNKQFSLSLCQDNDIYIFKNTTGNEEFSPEGIEIFECEVSIPEFTTREDLILHRHIYGKTGSQAILQLKLDNPQPTDLQTETENIETYKNTAQLLNCRDKIQSESDVILCENKLLSWGQDLDECLEKASHLIDNSE